MKGRVVSIAAVISLGLCLPVGVFWVRSRSGYDQVLWTYYRWRPDGSAAGSHVELKSERRLWISMGTGRVAPPNGHLVWGYYINADASGGRPRLEFHHERYDAFAELYFNWERGVGAWLPVTWYYGARSAQRDGDDSIALGVGVSHWLAALMLAGLPAWAAWRARFRFSLRSLIACTAMVGAELAILAPLLRQAGNP